MVIHVANIPVNIIKKDIKNLHLYVKAPDGRVEVTAPLRLGEDSIAMFVRTKISWIRKQQEKFANQERQTPREFVSGETVYFWGKGYYLHLLQGKKNAIEINGDEIYLTARADSTPKQRETYVNDWYRVALREQIEKLLPKWEHLTDLYPTGWQIKYMTTRWGTCNTQTGKIWFNLQLAKKPIECLEYVILHELAHLRVKNHSKDFVAILDEHMPYWRETRKQLNDLKLDFMPEGESNGNN